jgi:uncharacterized membrane protein YuzA (DUF378 family)
MDSTSTQPRSSTGIERLAAAAEGAADGLEEGMAEYDPMGATASALTEGQRVVTAATGRTPQATTLQPRLDTAKEKMHRIAQRTREGAHAVRETSERARAAPGIVAHDAKEATKAYMGGLSASAGMFAAAGLLAFFALACLTVGLVVGLGNLVDSLAGGAFLTMLLYGIAAAACIPFARKAKAAGARKAQEHMEHARNEVRQVGRPMRQALRRERM